MTTTAPITISQQEGSTSPNTDIRDVLRPANAIAWASQQAPDDSNLINRLFAISLGAPR